MDADVAKPEKPRKRRWLRWLLLASVGLLAGAFSLYLLWETHTQSTFEEEIGRLRAAGEPLTPEELWPPEIQPESENAALLYEQAYALFQESGYDAFEGGVGLDISWDDPGSWSEEATAAVRHTLAQCDEALALVRRAAHMERCRFDPNLENRPPTSQSPYFSLRDAARALSWSAGIKLRDGDVHGAVQDAHDAFLTSRAVADEPRTFAFMVRALIAATALDEAQNVLRDCNGEADLVRTFLADVRQDRPSVRAQLVAAYKGERVVNLVLTTQLLGRTDLLPKTSFSVGAPVGPRMNWFERRFIVGSGTVFSQTMTRMAEMAQADYVDARPLMDALIVDSENWKKHYLLNLSHQLTAAVVQPMVRNKEVETGTEARLAVAEAVFALRLYKAEHREYPESLDALSPAFLQAVPTDPFTSKPLVYVREGEGFLVYSIGLNGKDDGGLTETEEDDRAVDPGTDDVAWRCSR